MANEAVMSTNDDASSCKRFAVHKGYWEDDFIQYFVNNIPERKAPEINRGYYIRHRTVHHLINEFLQKVDRKCQIVSLGAGFDTLYWNLNKSNNLPKYGIYEVDMKPVVQRKCKLISGRSQLKHLLSGDIAISKFQITSNHYKLFAADITNIQELNNGLMLAGIMKDIPTLFLAECLFVYIPSENTQKLLEYVTTEFSKVMFVDYDPVNLNDRFGEVMKQNLRGRQCNLLGAHGDLYSKRDSYHMFPFVKAKLLFDVYIELPPEEKKRIEKIEFLDEIDLLFDLLKHYCVCWCYNDKILAQVDL